MAITETKGQGKGRSDRGKIPPHIPSLDQKLKIVNFFIEQGIFSGAEIDDIAELSRSMGPDNYLEVARSPETDTPALVFHQNGARPSAADVLKPPETHLPKAPKRSGADDPRLNNSRLNMGTVLLPDEEEEIISSQEVAPGLFSEALPPMPAVDSDEAQVAGGWEKHLTAVELAQRELEAGIETGISPAKGRVEIDGTNVMLLQGDVATLQLMRIGFTKRQIATRRYPSLPLAEAERQVDFSFARIADEFRWVKFSLVPQRREDGETIFELSRKNPQQQAKENDAPTLADRLGLRISSKIVTNSSRDLTQFDVEQGATEYSVILDKWESVIFKAYFSFTHIPTVGELEQSLPELEQRKFFIHLYSLNRKIEERLLISLSQRKKGGGGWDETVIVPKRVEPKPKPTPAPAAASEPTPAPLSIRPTPPTRRLFRNEIEEEKMSTKEVVSRVIRADNADPRRYEVDGRIPMRLIESLMPSEAKAVMALAGTSAGNTLSASGWATGLTAMQLMEQINPTIHGEGLRICRNPDGGYYLDDFIADLRPKLPEVKTG